MKMGRRVPIRNRLESPRPSMTECKDATGFSHLGLTWRRRGGLSQRRSTRSRSEPADAERKRENWLERRRLWVSERASELAEAGRDEPRASGRASDKWERGKTLLIRDKSNIRPWVLGETIACKTISARRSDFLTYQHFFYISLL